MTSCIKPLKNSRFYFATHLLLWNFVSTNSNLSGSNPSGFHHVQPGLLQCFGILVDPWWENPWRSWKSFSLRGELSGDVFSITDGSSVFFWQITRGWVALSRAYHQVSARVHSISDTSSSMRLLFDYQLREWVKFWVDHWVPMKGYFSRVSVFQKCKMKTTWLWEGNHGSEAIFDSEKSTTSSFTICRDWPRCT